MKGVFIPMKKMKLGKISKGGYKKFFLTKETKEKLNQLIPEKVYFIDSDEDNWWEDDTVLL